MAGYYLAFPRNLELLVKEIHMICPHCEKDTMGTETSPGTVSSTCPDCNQKLTGTRHHAEAYDIDGVSQGLLREAPPR